MRTTVISPTVPGNVDAEGVRSELSRSCWRDVAVVRAWSAERVWLSRPPRPLIDRLFRGDVGYRNLLGLVAFLAAAALVARLGAAEFDPLTLRGSAWVAGFALAAAGALYWAVREPRAVLDLRGAELRAGRRRIALASLQAVVIGESVFEEFQLIDGGQAISGDRRSFHRLELRTTAGLLRVLVSRSERAWPAEEVRAGRAVAAALAGRLNTELQVDDRA